MAQQGRDLNLLNAYLDARDEPRSDTRGEPPPVSMTDANEWTTMEQERLFNRIITDEVNKVEENNDRMTTLPRVLKMAGLDTENVVNTTLEVSTSIIPLVGSAVPITRAALTDDDRQRARLLLDGGGRILIDVATLGIGHIISGLGNAFKAFRRTIPAIDATEGVANDTRALKTTVESTAEAAANDTRYELEGMSEGELKAALKESEAAANEVRTAETTTEVAANETRAAEESGAAVNEARAVETATDAVANETRVLPKVRGRPRRMVKTDIALGLGGVTAMAARSQIPNAEAPIPDISDIPDIPDAAEHREPIVTSGGPLERRNPTIQLDLVTPPQSVALGTETTEYPIVPIAILLVAAAAAIYKWDT